jgi:hypothetical protein
VVSLVAWSTFIGCWLMEVYGKELALRHIVELYQFSLYLFLKASSHNDAIIRKFLTCLYLLLLKVYKAN